MRSLTSLLFVSLVAGCGAFPSSEPSETADEALTSYQVQVTTDPSPVVPDEPAELRIRVLGSGAPVTKFDDLHTQAMHLIAVSSDLGDFLHEHSVVTPEGDLRVDGVRFAKAQPYRLFLEYDPKGPDAERLSRATLSPVGAVMVRPKLSQASAFDGSMKRSALAGSTRVELLPLAHPMIMAGQSTTFRVALKTTSGTPVTDLTDWLGMPGHAIVLSEDASTFIHGHAMPPGTDHGGGHGGHGAHGGHGGHGGHGDQGAGSELDVELTLPSAGLYKMFFQFQRGGGAIETASFVLKATDGHHH